MVVPKNHVGVNYVLILLLELVRLVLLFERNFELSKRLHGLLMVLEQQQKEIGK